jgi:hypothetical protein
MRHRSRLGLVALTAAILLSFAVSSAGATRIEVNEMLFKTIWTSLEFSAGGQSPVLCPFTLAGLFQSTTFSKVCGQLIGYITHAYVGSACTGGTARVLTESLPWYIQYVRFGGILPNISSLTLDIVGAKLKVEVGTGVACLATTKQSEPFVGIASVSGSGHFEAVRADETRAIQFGHESFICEFAGAATVRGTGYTLSGTVGGGLLGSLIIRLVA